MCQAIQEMVDDSRAEGVQETTRKFAMKLFQRGYTPDEIAELTDMPQEIVICWLSGK